MTALVLIDVIVGKFKNNLVVHCENYSTIKQISITTDKYKTYYVESYLVMSFLRKVNQQVRPRL